MSEKEVWDLYDSEDHHKGTFIRGNGSIPPGLYHKTVEVIPTDMAGTLLLTRRSLSKRMGGGLLEFPAGSVIAGETEKDAAVRELLEETGLRPAKLFFLQKARTPGILRYTFLAYVPNIRHRKVIIPKDEVMDYQFVDYNTWLRLITSNDYNGFRTRFYTEKLLANVKTMVHHYADEVVEPPKQHAPLAPAKGLAHKPRCNTGNKCFEDNDTVPPADPEWEPSIEQGDDGT